MKKFNNYFQNIVNEAYVFGESDDFKDVYPAEHTIGNLLRAIGELIMVRVGVKRGRIITQIVKNALYLNDADLNDILNITSQKEKQKTPGDPTQM